MNVLDATEIAYKNGYKKGKADAMRDSDLVEVVRCKDCQHYIDGRCYVTNRKPLFTYDVNIHSRKENDFCSYGERKEG